MVSELIRLIPIRSNRTFMELKHIYIMYFLYIIDYSLSLYYIYNLHNNNKSLAL